METDDIIIRITHDEMRSQFLRALLKTGMEEVSAERCAEIFTVNSLEGVYSHGINRFPRFVSYINKGYIKAGAVPSLVHKAGALEQWDGNLGPGPLNAAFSTGRAMELALENGIGVVALANSNHWMRGGTYGWQAAKKGFVFIGWANTCTNMPAWGAVDARLGNNPFVIAVPYKDEAIVLDFAMTQFSYGKMEALNYEGKKLPFPGGFNNKGELTSDPGEILETMRPIPIGYWKGSGLSLMLDILAAILSGGLSAHQIGNCSMETGISQVFIVININKLKNFPAIDNSINQIINDLKNSVPESETADIRYPGENVIRTRVDNEKNGIPVSESLWKKILAL